MEYIDHDVFLSHASEDKRNFVAPLAKTLSDFGVKVWYDEFTLKTGDSLSRSIDHGLAKSRYGVVVLSKAFFSKPWPEYELRGLVSRELGRDKVILPVWHGVSRGEVLNFSPLLADKLALDTSRISIYEVAWKLLEVVRPDLYRHTRRILALRRLQRDGEPELVSVGELKPGPIRHKSLPDHLLIRAKVIYHVVGKLAFESLQHSIEAYMRDVEPLDEIKHWERMAAAYLDFSGSRKLDEGQQKDVFKVLLSMSIGMLDDDKAGKFEHLNHEEVLEVARTFADVTPKIVPLTAVVELNET